MRALSRAQPALRALGAAVVEDLLELVGPAGGLLSPEELEEVGLTKLQMRRLRRALALK